MSTHTRVRGDTDEAGPGLLALRHERGLSQERVAYLAGVGLATVIRLEHGRGRPRRATLAVIASALGCDPGDLLLAHNDVEPAANGLDAKERGAGARPAD